MPACITAALVAVGSAVTAGAVTGATTAVIGGAVIGAAVGGVVSAIRGGNILKGVLVGGLIGAAAGGGLAALSGTGAVEAGAAGAVDAATAEAGAAGTAGAVGSTAVPAVETVGEGVGSGFLTSDLAAVGDASLMASTELPAFTADASLMASAATPQAAASSGGELGKLMMAQTAASAISGVAKGYGDAKTQQEQLDAQKEMQKTTPVKTSDGEPLFTVHSTSADEQAMSYRNYVGDTLPQQPTAQKGAAA